VPELTGLIYSISPQKKVLASKSTQLLMISSTYRRLYMWEVVLYLFSPTILIRCKDIVRRIVGKSNREFVRTSSFSTGVGRSTRNELLLDRPLDIEWSSKPEGSGLYGIK
jgi:hypothetical protein